MSGENQVISVVGFCLFSAGVTALTGLRTPTCTAQVLAILMTGNRKCYTNSTKRHSDSYQGNHLDRFLDLPRFDGKWASVSDSCLLERIKLIGNRYQSLRNKEYLYGNLKYDERLPSNMITGFPRMTRCSILMKLGMPIHSE